MASSKDYLEYVLEQLSEAGDVTSRAMMSEYILYFRGKVIGGIYDNRFLVKPVQAARNMMPDAPEELPYDGAKPMLMVENIEDREFLKELFEAMYDELPERADRDNICCSFQALDSTAIYLSIKLLTFASYAAESVG